MSLQVMDCAEASHALAPFYTSYRSVPRYIIKRDTRYNQALPEASRLLQVPSIPIYYAPRYTSVRSRKRPVVMVSFHYINNESIVRVDSIISYRSRDFLFETETVLCKTSSNFTSLFIAKVQHNNSFRVGHQRVTEISYFYYSVF